MQSVSAAFTAEATDSVRRPVGNLQVSWKKHVSAGNRTFTIGVSTIGGSDLIGLDGGAISSPSNYSYFDESDYILNMSWERSLNIPLGGLSKAAGEFSLDNNSGRFDPDYMGGDSEIFTSVALPRRPFIINAGFEVDGTDYAIPQFMGVTTKPPTINKSQRTFSSYGFDYVDFLQNRLVDRTAIFTGITTDVAIETLLSQAGLTTGQYELDTGLNTIPFVFFESGDKMGDVLNELVQAENGHMFQDESGKYCFWNRQHWNNAPYNEVQHILLTPQVLNHEVNVNDRLNDLVNVVEVRSDYWQKRASDTLYYFDFGDVDSGEPIPIAANGETEVWVDFDYPALSLSSSINYFVYTQPDYGSTDITSSVSLVKINRFAKAAKLTFRNSSSNSGYMLYLEMFGRYIENTQDIYIRQEDSASVTAYEEQPLTIDNRFIQDSGWASSLAYIILQQYSDPTKIQKLIILALPHLQFGDLISWQGRDYRIYGIKTTLDPSYGFIQELTVASNNDSSTSYFTIGLSTIGGTDIIAQ